MHDKKPYRAWLKPYNNLWLEDCAVGWTNSALSKPQCLNRFSALSPSFDHVPTCCTITWARHPELKLFVETSWLPEIFTVFANRLPKNAEPVTLKEPGNNQSPEGFPRNTSANDRISSKSAAPGFPQASHPGSPLSTRTQVKQNLLSCWETGDKSLSSKDSQVSAFSEFSQGVFKDLVADTRILGTSCKLRKSHLQYVCVWVCSLILVPCVYLRNVLE